MANPAELLLRQLRAWDNPAKTPPSKHRKLDTAERAEHLRHHEIAMAHVSAIRELLGVLAATTGVDYSIYEKAIPQWTEMILNYPHAWNPQSSVPTKSFNPTALAHLQTLAPQIDRVVPSYTDQERASLRTTFDDIATLLGEDDSLPTQMRTHFALMIGHMRQTLLEYDISGDFELYRANVALKSLVDVATKNSKSRDRKPRWRQIGKELVFPTVVPMAIESASVYAQYQLGM